MKVKDQETGEIIKDTSIKRENIGEKTREKLRNAETVEDIKEYLAWIHDIDLNPEE